MEQPSPCPDEATIAAFLEGRLAAGPIAEVDAHLVGCVACRELVAAVAPAVLADGSRLVAAGRTGAPEVGGRDTTAEPLARGATVGRYVILGLVGRGGMGDVYAAYDPELDRKIALKLLNAGGAAEESKTASRGRLLKEAKAIARLSHPNVVAVHDAGMIDGRVFVAMEYVEGKTLAAWLGGKPRTWREIRGLFLAAGRGLAAAHAAGIVHRDFKPQNVMVAADGTVRVMDFGLASDLGAREDGAPERATSELADFSQTAAVGLTRTGTLVGTPAYMAPEQFLARRADARTDQFCYCVSLYEALHGERPFAGASLSALAESVKSGRVREPPPRVHPPTWLRKIVLRGLRSNPDERFPTMPDLLGRLARDPSRQRRRALIGAAVVAVLLAGGALGQRTLGPSAASVCRAAGERLRGGVWEPSADGKAGPRRSAVERAFVVAGRSGASETWARVARELDQYAERWTAAYTEACEATHVRKAQSAEALDLRMTCLQERLGQVKALTDVFASADADVVIGAVDAVDSLGSLDRCNDLAQLQAVDARVRAAVDALRPRLAAVKALRDAGRHRDALQAGLSVAEDARKVGYQPLLAEALSLVGWLQEVTADYTGALATLLDAVNAGEAGRNDEVKADAASQLIAVLGFHLSRHEEGERWARFAEAAVERLGPGHDRQRAWILTNRSVIRKQIGDLTSALELEETSLALKQKLLGPDHPDVAISLNNMGVLLSALGDHQRSLALTDQGLAICRKAYGDSHPWVARALSNRGETLNALGRFGEARASFQDALTRWERVLAPDHPYLGYALTGLGLAELGMGDAGAAVATLERAVRLRERVESDVVVIAETRFALARALWKSNGDRTRARGLAVKARQTYAGLPLLAEKRREVDAWLSRPPAP